jgi:peptidase E
MATRTIVAMGGGGFLMEPENPRLDDYILSLAGKREPRVLFVPTASGDADARVFRFYQAFPTSRCVPSDLALFRRTVRDLRDFILSQDIVYVGGGNTANMLAVWRVHGVDKVLREAYERGVILAGLSAGALCWFECGVTDSFIDLAAIQGCLGLLKGSNCPHYDGEAARQPTYRRLIQEGLSAGYAADDGAALRFENEQVAEVVSSRPDARAYRVEVERGRICEKILWPRFL